MAARRKSAEAEAAGNGAGGRLRFTRTPGSEVLELVQPAASTAERVRRLQAEARALAHGEIEALAAHLTLGAEMARLIAEGGDAYPVGARELASRLASDLPGRAETMRTILGRA